MNRTNGFGNGSDMRPSFTIKKNSENDEAENRKQVFTALNRNASARLRAYQKYKNMVTRFIPLSYNVHLMPSKLNVDVTKPSINGMEMKIKMDVQLFCNQSTNLLYISTKEFSNIDLK